MADGQLCLYNGVSSFGAVELWIAGIFKIDIAIVAKGDIVGFEIRSDKVEHGEVAICTLGLSAVACQYYVFGFVAHAYHVYSVDGYFAAVRGGFAIARHAYGFIVGIVNPIDRGLDIDFCPCRVG